MLITGLDSDRGRDREVIEDFYALFVLEGDTSELVNGILEQSADHVVVKAGAKAVVFPAIPQAAPKQRGAPIPGERIGRFRCIPDPTEHANAAELLATFQLFANRFGIRLLDSEILRDTRDHE